LDRKTPLSRQVRAPARSAASNALIRTRSLVDSGRVVPPMPTRRGE
jgi:hypothetical protein